MQYLKPYTYFYKKPNKGWSNVLMVVVCGFIPFIGIIIVFGYRKRVCDELERDPNLETYPDFDFNNFMDYLKLGVWPFLTHFIGMMAMMVPFMVLYFVALIGMMSQTIHPLVVLVALILCGFGSLFVNILLWPMEIYAMRAQKFAPVTEIQFAFRFLRTIGLSSVVSVVFANLSTVVCICLGMMLCFIGVYPAAAITNMAIQHFQTQLYLLYLEEGGEPVAETLSFADMSDGGLPPRTTRGEVH